MKKEIRPKAMISQPMTDLDVAEIKRRKWRAQKWLNKQGFDVVNTYFENDDKIFENESQKTNPVFLLAKSIEVMSQVEVVYFCKGWEGTRGCRIEHKIAETYGKKRIYE